MFNVVSFLQKLISIESCDPPGQELHIAKCVHQQLLALGIHSELDEFLPGRANVLGRIKGRGEKKPLVFSAHLDTVPIGKQPWSFLPFSGDIVDGHIRGRGASDMKGAVAAFVAAAAEIAQRPEPLAADIVLAFTAGESSNCLGARRFVAQGLQNEIGAFLCGEPSTLDIIAVEKAILWLEAKAVGMIGHVSGSMGQNAILMMSEFLLGLQNIKLDVPSHPLLSPPSINVGAISGGSAINVTPDECRAEIDVRFGPGIAVEQVMHQLELVMPPGITLTISDFKPAVEEDPASDFIQVCAQAIKCETGHPPTIKGVSYYSDGAILLDGIKAPFAILGPGYLGMSGQANEVIKLDNLHAAVRIYRSIAENWLKSSLSQTSPGARP